MCISVYIIASYSYSLNIHCQTHFMYTVFTQHVLHDPVVIAITIVSRIFMVRRPAANSCTCLATVNSDHGNRTREMRAGFARRTPAAKPYSLHFLEN